MPPIPTTRSAVEDLQSWELFNGVSLDDHIVLIHTGYGERWPDREKYLGTAEQGREAVAKLHFPGLDPVAADWLVTKRNVRMVGIDTASIDHGQTTDYPDARPPVPRRRPRAGKCRQPRPAPGRTVSP